MGDPRRFHRAIGEGPPLVLDAAMGTRLIELGLDLNIDDPALWNLTHPEVVLSIHRRDRQAGADVLFTNTFGAGLESLRRLGRTDDLDAINRSAVTLARQAAGVKGFVVGSIGPGMTDAEGKSSLRQAVVLVDAGVDGLVLETHLLDQAERTLRAILPRLDVPVLVSLYRWPDAIDLSARKLLDLGAAAVGVNCGLGPESAIEATERFFRRGRSPWMVKPSAGDPGGSFASPSHFGEIARRFRELGVRMIGGCCGTTEAHIAAIRQALDKASDAE